ncbi:hypothetical protein Gotri_019097 [Gossypium trilobum]|uniref:Uncharacterized protein n=1 Tax=Gossypium trilobum TaxID=34281 RepID=A0A7J9ECH7_9ROSI|nr:hypothetical protein [Gossypium trilobum]
MLHHALMLLVCDTLILFLNVIVNLSIKIIYN